MRRWCSWLSALLASVVLCVSADAGSDSSLVVSWSEKCPSTKHIMVDLSVDGSRVYRQAIPICLTERNSLPGGRMSTTLQTELSHFGEPRLIPLEVDFWEASADPDALILGVSFASKDRVWLNTLHVAFSDRPATTELAPGVSLKSYPWVSAKPPNKSLERTRER